MHTRRQLLRKLKILMGFLIIRKVVIESYQDGSPKRIVWVCGEERYLRKLGERRFPGKKNGSTEELS